MKEIQEKLFDEALHWVVRLDSDDITNPEKQQFLQWLEKSAAHQKVFNDVERLWSGFGELDVKATQDLESYAYLPLPPWHPTLIMVWLREFFERYFTIPKLVIMTTTTLMAFLSVMIWHSYAPVKSELYETAVGEQKTIVLQDGSSIYLNTKSRILVKMQKTSRLIMLEEGEAFFDVARHTDWPFDVQSGNGRVHVLGTRFNVHKEASNQVTVTVASGQVEVFDKLNSEEKTKTWRRSLVTGQQLSYSDVGVVTEVSAVDIDNAMNWRRGLIIFQDETLIDVIAELNRYSNRRIVLLDPALGDIRIGGVFKTADISSAISSLEKATSISVVINKDFIGINSREQKNK